MCCDTFVIFIPNIFPLTQNIIYLSYCLFHYLFFIISMILCSCQSALYSRNSYILFYSVVASFHFNPHQFLARLARRCSTCTFCHFYTPPESLISKGLLRRFLETKPTVILGRQYNHGPRATCRDNVCHAQVILDLLLYSFLYL